MAQVVLVVHGMGNEAGAPSSTDRTSWAKDVEGALRTAASSYGVAAEKLIVVPILYDDVFQRYALTWQKLAESLKDTPLANITSFMKNAAAGGFVWGSIGDVIQYRAMPLVRQNVHTAVAAQIASAVAKHGTTHNYSVLAHSLGTAVAHDAITALAKREVLGSTVMQPPNFRFANFFAVANVSRLIWATTDDFYKATCVRPFDSGLPVEQCTLHSYLSFRHVADPISSIVRFKPSHWSAERYKSFDVRHFREVNVHGFLHYMQSPQVTHRIIGRLFPLAVTPELRQARFDAFPDYVGPEAALKKAAVDSVAQMLDLVNGSAKGKLELDVDAIVKALLQSQIRLG